MTVQDRHNNCCFKYTCACSTTLLDLKKGAVDRPPSPFIIRSFATNLDATCNRCGQPFKMDARDAGWLQREMRRKAGEHVDEPAQPVQRWRFA